MITYGTSRTTTTQKTPEGEEPWYMAGYKSAKKRGQPSGYRTKRRMTARHSNRPVSLSQRVSTAQAEVNRRNRIQRFGYDPLTANVQNAVQPYGYPINIQAYRSPGTSAYSSPYQPVREWRGAPLNEADLGIRYQTRWRDPSARIPQIDNTQRFLNAADLRTSSYGEEYDRQLNFYRQIFGSGFTGPWLEGTLPYVSSVPAQYAQPQSQAGLPAGYSGYGGIGSYGGYGGYGRGGGGYRLGGGGGGGYASKSATPWKDYASNWIQSVANWRI